MLSKPYLFQYNCDSYIPADIVDTLYDISTHGANVDGIVHNKSSLQKVCLNLRYSFLSFQITIASFQRNIDFDQLGKCASKYKGIDAVRDTRELG